MKPLTKHEAIMGLRNAQLEAGHSINTRKSYRRWMLRYRLAREEKQAHDLQSFLTYLSTIERLNPKTVKLALNALKFYSERVLGIEIPPNSLNFPAVNKNKNVPVWLTHEEAMDLISRMTGKARLQAEILYGTGSRITALLTLRLKDIDIQKGLVTFRHDKGGKSRTVRLPRAIMPKLLIQIGAVRQMWETDHANGVIFPTAEPHEIKKLGRKRFGTLPYCWLFPSRYIRNGERWHATDRVLTEELARAAADARLTKRVSPHVFRHSNATTLLERGENIRTIQQHLGHTQVETTEIYTHANGSNGVISPLDYPPITQITHVPSVIPFPRTA